MYLLMFITIFIAEYICIVLTVMSNWFQNVTEASYCSLPEKNNTLSHQPPPDKWCISDSFLLPVTSAMGEQADAVQGSGGLPY